MFYRMVFTVLGAVAELERSLIVERVKAGTRNAKAKGKLVGRPKVNVDVKKISALRDAGRSWSEISRQTGLTKGTAQRAFYSLPKKGCDIVSRIR
jgi:putative DNA-invertase from lambdoid prophage Rac